MSWNLTMFTGASFFTPPCSSPGTAFAPPPTCWETPWEPALLNTCRDMNWRTGMSKWVTQWLKRMKWRNHISWFPRKAKLKNPWTVRPRCRRNTKKCFLEHQVFENHYTMSPSHYNSFSPEAPYLPSPPCPDRIGKYSSKIKGGFCSGQNV